MDKWHYTCDELVAAIRNAGVGPGDVVSLQVSLGRLGLLREAKTYPEIANLVIDSFLTVLGPKGTLIVPTYTYSIGRGEMFEVETTPSAIGGFPEIFRKRAGVVRSRDPMMSTAGYGKSAHEILRDISNECYGVKSVFDNLRMADGKIVILGLGVWWATYCHYVECIAGVPFRYRKLFTGVVREHGVSKEETWIYYASPYIANCQSNSLALEGRIRSEGLLSEIEVGRGRLNCIPAQAYFEFGLAEFGKNPWLTAKGPPCRVAELVRLEDERVGARKTQITLRPDATTPEIIAAVRNMPRDLISDGYDAALQALAGQIPMTVHEFPSGTECWSWIIPEKWTCRNGYLETMDGKRLLSYEENALHVPSYSWPYEGIVSRQELIDHLTVHPVLKDATPSHSLIHRREWGLCCSQLLRETLMDEQYRVGIDADFSYGMLKVGESVVHGQSEDCIVLCGQLNQPAHANDRVSGCAVALVAMRELAKRVELRFSYRLLLLPGYLGALAYLRHHRHLIPKIKAGLFLEALDSDHPIVMQHSFDSGGAFDRCCLAVLQTREAEFQPRKFLGGVASEEPQFDAPGVHVPMVTLSRAPQPYDCGGSWPDDRHQNDQDAPRVGVEKRLNDSVQVVLDIINAWEDSCLITNDAQS